MHKHPIHVGEIQGTGIEKPAFPVTAPLETDLLSREEVDIILDAMNILGVSWEDIGTLFGFGIPGRHGCKWQGGFSAKPHVHERIKTWNDLATQASFVRVAPLFVLAQHHPVYAGYILQSLAFDAGQNIHKLVNNFWRSIHEKNAGVCMVPRSL